MARKKKYGKRAVGIQGKSGRLYIVMDKYVLQEGKKIRKREWIDSGLEDIPENVKEAQEKRELYIRKNNVLGLDRDITVSELVDMLLAEDKRGVADTTFSSYQYRGKRIKEFFGDTKVRVVNKIMIEEFLDDLFTSRELVPGTVNHTKSYLGKALKKALDGGVILSDPMKDVTISKSLAREYAKEKNQDDEFFSYEEATHFLEVVEEHELYEYFYVSLFFGLRREEALGIKWSSINLSKKTLTICHTVTRGTKINRNNAAKSKDSIRTYPLTDEQVEMFQYIKDREMKSRKLFGAGYYDSDYVFKHEDGTLYYTDYPTKQFAALIKANPDLPQHITLRGLRTSCVSILVHEGMDIKSIQKWVGHADIETTLKIYAKVKEKEAKQAVSVSMSNVIQPKKYCKERN